MILNESFRYRGLSMTELDDIIYAHQMNHSKSVDMVPKPLLVKVLERLDAIDARLASIEALLAGNDTPDEQEEADESPLFLGGE